MLVSSPHPDTAEMLSRYAAFTGATVFQVQDPAENEHDPFAGVVRREGCDAVLVLDCPDLPGSGAASIARIRKRWSNSGVRILLLERGRRQRARLLDSGMASLDLDAMRRAAFLRALALATGRIPPEAGNASRTPALPALRRRRSTGARARPT